MKLKLNELGQLRVLCHVEIVPQSSGEISQVSRSVPDGTRPKGKTFPPKDKASSLFFVVPTLG